MLLNTTMTKVILFDYVIYSFTGMHENKQHTHTCHVVKIMILKRLTRLVAESMVHGQWFCGDI